MTKSTVAQNRFAERMLVVNILESIALGIVQGLTEFLPVSSSGHLVLLQKALGVSAGGGTADPSMIFFNVMLHVGTLVAVVMILWKEVLDLFRRPINLLYLFLASVPAGLAYLLFPEFFNDAFSGQFLGFSFLATSLILALSEIIAQNIKAHRELKYGGALSMGLMQAVGMLPGVSRSGSTIAGGLIYGADRRKVASFSFLMSIPAILAPAALEGYNNLIGQSFTIDWAPVVIGTLCAAAAGYIAVKFMLALIARKKLYGFALYTAILGILVLLDQYVLGIVTW